MQIQYLIVREGDNVIVGSTWRPDPDAGPTIPQGGCPVEGARLVRYDDEFTRAGRSGTDEARWVGGAVVWVDGRNLDECRSAKAGAISNACREYIEAGFHCAALGATHLYPAKSQDQANLVASVTDSLLAGDEPDWATPFWCADEAGVWDYRLHTAAQIRKVGREGKAAIVAALQRNEALQRQVAAANIEQLESINW